MKYFIESVGICGLAFFAFIFIAGGMTNSSHILFNSFLNFIGIMLASFSINLLITTIKKKDI